MKLSCTPNPAGMAAWLCWSVVASVLVILPTAHAAEPGAVDFNREIRPILAEKCFACHGPDEKQRKAGMRLDIRAGILAETKNGTHPVVPGDPEESEIHLRITADDDTVRMPPPKSGKTLTPAEVQKITRWIEQGAKWAEHWSFVPPVRPEPPAVKDTTWARNPIDRFVLAKLESAGLAPSPEADRETLLRRVTLDLTGLPPTLAEVDAFVQDKAPDAYEKVVDRLLASPRFGERMALWWLDGARYADSNGYQADFERYMWRWRDWVIDAFNANKPFDQFTVDQLAGDLLPNASLDQKIATGFHRNHRINTEGGIIAEEWRVEGIVDRVETTSLVWLGLTMGCARCHDHKYDPIGQKDFYRVFAFFNNIRETGIGEERPINHPPVLKAPRPAEQQKLRELESAVAQAEQAVKEKEPLLPALQDHWEKENLPKLFEQRLAWPLLQLVKAESKAGATLTRLDDGSILASGKNAPKDVYTLTLNAAAAPITGLRLEAMTHESLAEKSFGRAGNGNIVLTRFEAEVASPGQAHPSQVKFHRTIADYSQAGWPIDAALGTDPSKGWAVDGFKPEKRLDRQALFVAEQPIVVPEGGTLTVRLRCETLDNHTLGRFRLTATTQHDPKLPESPVPSAVAQALLTDPYKRTDAQKAELARYVRANYAGPLTEVERALAKAKAELKAFDDALPTVMVMSELDQPRDCFVLLRGQYDKHGEKVTAGLPAVLPPMPAGQPMNRLGLARWIVDPGHPLTARVQVNRFWELLFGVGIVKSSENFGVQGEVPSHPELLDWLATEFVRQGWNVKGMLKTMVTSATYRQSSRVSPQLLERDPENRLLARGPRFRLQAEAIRDQALAVSGLLVEQLGGPSVRPYQPDGIWDELNVYGNLRNYKHDTGPGLYRRSLYTIWKRTAAPPQMLIFDAPSRELCTIRRPRTNTPLQALVLLNDVTFVEPARVLAEQMIRDGGSSPADRLTYAFRRATGRRPSEAELKVLTDGVQARLAKYRADIDAARKLIAQGERKPDPRLDPAELAAYTLSASVILNLDETVTKD